MDRIKKVVRPLPPNDQKEVLLEFNSHIYEALINNNQETEIDRLLDVLENLGEPEEVLKPLIADKRLEQATRTFNPLHVIRALALNITNGISYIIFFILYLCLFGFVFLIYAKIENPQEVGLYFKNGHFLALGKINSEYLGSSAYTEALGIWFIPAMMLSIIIFYLLITLLLKFKNEINKKFIL